MNNISLSQLKINPSKAIGLAEDAPLTILNRNQVAGYILSKEMYEALVDYIEDYTDAQTVEATDFSEGRDFEEVAKELGI